MLAPSTPGKILSAALCLLAVSCAWPLGNAPQLPEGAKLVPLSVYVESGVSSVESLRNAMSGTTFYGPNPGNQTYSAPDGRLFILMDGEVFNGTWSISDKGHACAEIQDFPPECRGFRISNSGIDWQVTFLLVGGAGGEKEGYEDRSPLLVGDPLGLSHIKF